MKKLLVGLLALAVIIGAGMMLLVSNLDSIVKRAVESAGTDALGTPVRLESVAIDLRAGTASLYGFSVANPPGYSDQDMIRVDELSVAIDIASLNSDVIRITSIRSVNPYVLYELQGTRGNLNAIMDQFPPAAETQEPAGPLPVIAIDEISVNGIQGSLQSAQVSRAVDINLGNVLVTGVQGTPDELATQISRPLIAQLARNAAAALSSAIASGALEGELQQRASEAVDDLRSEAADQLEQAEDAVRSLRDRLLNNN
mgnify:FL=1